MMRKRIFFVVILTFMLGSWVAADQITLKNGDRLTGTITEVNDEELSMKSELLDTIKVKWPAIAAIVSDQPLYVTMKDQRMLTGPVAAHDTQIDIRTQNAGNLTVARGDVRTMRSQEEQEAFEAEQYRWRHPGLFDFWGGSADIGLTLTRGNSATTTLEVNLGAARITRRDKLSLYYMSLFAEEGTSVRRLQGRQLITTEQSLTTAQSFQGGARYDHNLKGPLFAFSLADFASNKFQDLNLRSLLGGGLGVHVVRAESTRLDLYAGAGYDWENFATRGQDRLTPPPSLPQSRQARLDRFQRGLNSLTRRSWELIVGDEFTRQISDAVSLQQRMTYYPNLSESGEYRLAFDASIATQINRWLEWQVSFTDRYLSNPLPGIKKNDVLLTTGLRFTFGNSDQATYQGLDRQDSGSDSSQSITGKKGSSQSSGQKATTTGGAAGKKGKK